MLIRTQVQLTDTQLDGLRALSIRQQRSLADLVREGVDLYLQRASAGDRTRLIERAKGVAGQYRSGASRREGHG